MIAASAPPAVAAPGLDCRRAATLAGRVACRHPGPAVAGRGRPAGTPACRVTRIASLGFRLEGKADSGTALAYADGRRQVSYATLAPAAGSRVGDAVRLCVVARPVDCPAGDARGATLSAENLRTGGRWTAADSSHRCGGA